MIPEEEENNAKLERVTLDQTTRSFAGSVVSLTARCWAELVEFEIVVPVETSGSGESTVAPVAGLPCVARGAEVPTLAAT